MQDLSNAPLYGRPTRARSRLNAERAHARRNDVATVANKRATGLKHKTRGTAPREVFVPLKVKAIKLARRAGLHREKAPAEERAA